MTAPEPDGIIWHTSSYSAGHGDCVEVAPAPERILVRDSKDPDGPALPSPPRPGGRSSPPSPADHRVPAPMAIMINSAATSGLLIIWHLRSTARPNWCLY
jgi:hypothetical protein